MPPAWARFRQRYLRGALLLAVGALAALIALAAYQGRWLRVVELHTFDDRLNIRGTQSPPQDVVVVQIDDKTFNDLGIQWPFPRSLHAQVIRRISADRPRVIAYDVQFTEETKLKEDNALIEAVARSGGKVVLATSEVDAQGRTRVLGGDLVLRRIHARAANAAFPPDPDGALRHVPYSIEGLRSFAVAAAETASGHKVVRSSVRKGGGWIDFYGPAGTIPSISFSRVLAGHVERGFFSGKVVVVGASAGSLQDVHATATSGSELMSGPEIEANAISTVLRGFPLRSPPKGFDFALVLLSAFVVPVANLRLRLTLAVLVGIVAVIGLIAGIQIAFNTGWVLTFVYPIAALVLSAVGVLGARYAATVMEKRGRPAVVASETAAAGEAALSARDFEGAFDLLSRSQRLWQEAGVPFEAARCRVLLAEACRGLNDVESATMQLRAAQQAFEQLGAVSEERAAFEAIQMLLGPDAAAPGSEQALRTFMFTDIVESTALLDAIGDDAWAHVHRWHDDTLRALIGRHQGEEVSHTGDGFFVAFADVNRAVACAIVIQKTLEDHRRTHGFSPRVRIGLHTSVAMRRGKDGYEGMGVHTAARISAQAQGGEILASRETLAQIDGAIPVTARQSMNLKGIAIPVEVAAVCWDAVAGTG